MPFDIQKFLDSQQHLIVSEKKRLGLLQDSQVQHDRQSEDLYVKQTCEAPNSYEIQSCNPVLDNKENLYSPVTSCEISARNPVKQNQPLVERLDLNSIGGNLEKNKQAFIDKLVNSENPLTFRSNDGSCCSMLRYGEYSPNNPQFKVATAPYIGLGEYEQRRQLFSKQRKADYLQHLSKKNEQIENTAKSILLESKSVSSGLCKSVQTDIQNIHTKLIQYELHSQDPAERELSPQIPLDSFKDSSKSLVSQSSIANYPYNDVQSRLLKTEMDKPKSILSKRSGTARERAMAEYRQSSMTSFLDGFSFPESRAELHEKERLKREAYQADLRQQIEEKRRLSALRDEQERRQQELENRRLEQQLLRMQEEELMEQQKSRRDEQYRRNSEDYMRRKHELQSRSLYRRHIDSESSVMNSRNTNVASKPLSHYSPPISRRNPYSFNVPSSSVFSEPSSRYNPSKHFDGFSRRDNLSRLDSLNAYDTNSSYNAFSRYDSLSRIDSLKHQDSLSRQIESLSVKDNLNLVQRRHSATQQDLSLIRRSPKLQRRSSSSRFDDTLPIPVLKAHSPVAKELRNSIAVNSSRSSEAVRRLEDKWQVPAVQRNIINHGDPLRDGPGKSILTQLGAIRMQLQQEQLRMDETLRQRSITQSKAVDFH